MGRSGVVLWVLACVACGGDDDGEGVPVGEVPGEEAGAATRADSGADAGAGAGADSDSGSESGSGSGTDSGSDSGTDSGTDSGSAADAGADSGTDSAADAGADSGTDSGSAADAGADSGTDSGSAADSGTDSGTDGGADASVDAGNGDDGGSDDGGPGAWPQMGYDERNWYYNPDETALTVDNAGSLQLDWAFTVAGTPNGTPTVGDGRVYLVTTGGSYGVDLQTGALIWSRSDITGTSSAAFDAGAVYVHDASADLWKLDAANGSTVWGPVRTNATSGCDGTSSPILAGDRVIVGRSCGALEVSLNPGGAEGGVEAHRSSDGVKLWSYLTTIGADADGAMVWSSVGVDLAGNTVFASSGNNYTVAGAGSDAIHAIDLGTGSRTWVQQVRSGDVWSLSMLSGADADFGANPIVLEAGGQSLVAAGDKGSDFWALNRATGAVEWSRTGLTPARDAAHGGILMNGAFDGSLLYTAANNTALGTSVVYALDPAQDGDTVWSRSYSAYAWGAPSIANGVLVVPIDDELKVLRASDGAELNSFNTGGTIAGGAAAIVDGRVVVGSGLSYPLAPDAKANDQVLCYALP